MPSIDEIILRNTNPFDNIYCANLGNNQEYSEPTISYIHQETFVKIEALVSQVLQDHLTRTVLITGDTGCGKTYLLTRLKSQLNHKTCFVHIPPFAKRDYIWRWILRYVVDNLIKVTDDNQTSPLLLWLSTINEGKDTLLGFLRSEKQKFINKLKEKYKQVNIYHPDIFFAILYELTNPELSDLAGKYLRGDDLSEESLQALGVENSINTETTARETLSNFSKISCDVQPIILCFNQLESIARLPDGALDLNALFQVNAKIREDNNNFLIIISIATHTWEQNKYQVEESYQSHINQKVELRNISLAQAELILVSRLEYLHRQATSQLSSPLYPLSRRQLLEKAFPRGRMNFRDVIIYGKNVFKEHKENLAKDDKNSTFTFYKKTQDKLEIFSYFKVRWYEEFSQSRQQITHISQISSPELIQFLQEVLLALQIEKVVNPLFIGTKYASYSLGYEFPNKPQILGVVWTEDANLNSFFT